VGLLNLTRTGTLTSVMKNGSGTPGWRKGLIQRRATPLAALGLWPPGGIVAVVSRGVSHSIVAAEKYSVWTRLELEGGNPVFIGECYFPHSTNVRKHRLGWIEVSYRAREYAEVGHVVLMGDFNAHVGLHGDTTDAAGRMLLRHAKELNLRVLNGTDLCEGNSTRIMEFKDGTATSTTIDFVMVSESLMPNVCGMVVVADRMGSDHCMTTLKVEGLQPAPGPTPELREAWRMENIPHHKAEGYEGLVKSFQSVFRGWQRPPRQLYWGW